MTRLFVMPPWFQPVPAYFYLILAAAPLLHFSSSCVLPLSLLSQREGITKELGLRFLSEKVSRVQVQRRETQPAS